MADPRVRETEQAIANLTYDDVVEAVNVIESSHREVHEGEHYTASDYAAVTLGNNRDYLLTTPNTAARMHLVFSVSTDAKAKISLFEAGNITGGTGITAYNNERNSANTATLTIAHTPTVTTTGTEISTFLVGSGNKAGGDARGDAEFVLKQNTKYLVRVAAAANLDQCSRFTWYEEN